MAQVYLVGNDGNASIVGNDGNAGIVGNDGNDGIVGNDGNGALVSPGGLFLLNNDFLAHFQYQVDQVLLCCCLMG